jgi:EamA domain-containing membrane protein RarD
MKTIAGTISLSVSFTLFIYLLGLKMENSVKYDSGLFFLPIILLILSLVFFRQDYKREKNKS